jgi:16S rRNA (cytidine1402-2'-O)-methyltransferase
LGAKANGVKSLGETATDCCRAGILGHMGDKPSRTSEKERSRRYTVAGHAFEAPRLPAGLTIVATPIGNLRDITLRALEILAGADLVACEDTRVTRKLFEHYGISTPLIAYHDHNAEAVRPKILERLAAGAAVALVSDAGTPLISDPGYRLVREAVEAGHTVTAAPGASSALMALTVAGLPTDRFFFEGFLPAKDAARRTRIAELARIPATLVLFESGPRLGETLADLAAGLGARRAAVARELTKLHEEVRRGDLTSLAGDYAAGAETRGEMVIVIAPPQAEPASADDIDALLARALARTTVKEAVSEVASATGAPRRAVYSRALELAKAEKNGTPDRT